MNSLIERFFEGDTDFRDYPGHVWIARHGTKVISRKVYNEYSKHSYLKLPEVLNISGDDFYINEFETLTIEPLTGGQYEVAVRIFSEGEWKGYFIPDNTTDTHPRLWGVNTRGH